MIFTSLSFFLFLPVVVFALFFLPMRFQKSWLILAGLFFYSFSGHPAHLILMIVSAFLDYLISKHLINSKKSFLFGLAFNNIGLLLFFKYGGSLTIPTEIIPSSMFLMPLGLSFYIFRKISYIVDCYRGTVEPAGKFSDFLLFVSFFPAVTSGPIDRYSNFTSHFRERVTFEYDRVVSGLRQMLWGFFKKLVIADRLGDYVAVVYDGGGDFGGPAWVLATLYFGIQIYCDFSAYSDIAIGAGRIIGFNLPENFDRPYFAVNLQDFWNRWHISLSKWLRDYLFLPVSFNLSKVLKNQLYAGIATDKLIYFGGSMVTMLICGMWHGSTWGFVLWGGVHGIYLSFSFFTKKIRKRLVKKTGLKKRKRLHLYVQRLVTLFLVQFAWIFFRSNNPEALNNTMVKLFTGWGELMNRAGFWHNVSFGLDRKELVTALFFALIMFCVEGLMNKKWCFDNAAEWKLVPRWVVYVALVMTVVVFGTAGSGSFIYFDF